MATLSSKVAPSGIATLAQGTLADSAVQPNDSPTFDGLAVQTADLGTTAGDSIESLSLRSDTSNTDQMLFTAERISTGANWETAAHKMQRKVDSSLMGYMQFGNSVHDLITFGENATEYMRIDGSGRVGINTTTPESQLHVAGSGTIARLKGSGGDYHGLGVQCSDASGSATKSFFIDTLNENGAAVANQIGQVQSDGGSNWHWSTQPAGARTDRRQERMRITASGSVGIGTSTPSGDLDVVSDTQRYLFRSGRIDCANAANNAWGTFVAQADQVHLRSYDGVTRFRMSVNGRVDLPNASGARGWSGYPITTPNDTIANALRSNGYIEWQTDVGAVGTNYFTSDERKKDNIIPATKQSSEVIEAIQFIEFDWKPDSGGEGHVEVGVSAQQLETIDPRLVSTLSDDTLMVNEPALVSHIAKALQEALTKIEALEARLVALEAI